MKKIIFLILVILIGLPGFSQNLILNGSDWIDSDSDGLADFWEQGPFVNEMQIDAGTQYVSSWNQSMIFQYVQLANTMDHTYRCEFDLASNLNVNVNVWWNDLNGTSPLMIMPSDSLQHYVVYFIQSYPSMVKFGFVSYPGIGWLQIDNVELYDITTVGVPELTQDLLLKTKFFSITGSEFINEPTKGVYLKQVGNTITKIVK